MKSSRVLGFTFVVAMFLSACGQSPHPDEVSASKETQMMLRKLTPVLLTNDVEACIAFWENFGLEATIKVPGPDGLSFASVTKGGIEVMYQTFASAVADSPSAVEGINRSMLYFEVHSLDTILPIVKQFEIVAAERTTPYGSREIYIRDPAGNVIGFAEHQSNAE